MKSFCSFAILFVCSFSGSKCSEVVPISVQLNSCNPETSCFNVSYALIPRSVVLLLSSVSMILRRSRFAQIFPAIVSFKSISMIDFVFRPFAFFKHPDKSMRKIFFAADSYFDAPLVVQTPCYVTNSRSSRKFNFPKQLPGMAIVQKSVSDEFGREILVGFFGASIHGLLIKLYSGIVK
jgi:hypothetical protein